MKYMLHIKILSFLGHGSFYFYKILIYYDNGGLINVMPSHDDPLSITDVYVKYIEFHINLYTML